MSYTELTSYQFERGKGFTEESVLAFRVLALNVIDDLMRGGTATTMATFPLSQREVALVLDQRAHADHVDPHEVVHAQDADHSETDEPVQPALHALPDPVLEDIAPPTEVVPDIGQETTVDEPESPMIGLDPDFAAAARWLELATRNDIEPYRPSIGEGRP